MADAQTQKNIDYKKPREDAREQRKNPRRSFAREARVKPEFEQQIISIRRVTRVASGGRRFSFSVAIVAGNRKGSVGVGLGKAGDTSLAIDKAMRDAKKKMIKIPLTKSMSIPFGLSAKFCGSVVQIIPTPGKGLVAGSAVRSVLELGGVNDVSAKILSRSKNKLNNAEVAIAALKKIPVHAA